MGKDSENSIRGKGDSCEGGVCSAGQESSRTNLDFSVGDLVIKWGDLDEGQYGIVLGFQPPNSNGNAFVKVMRSADGQVTTWYADRVEAVNEDR